MPAENWLPSRSTRRRLRSRFDPLATGWAHANTDLIIAVVPFDHLSLILSRLHREGYGTMIRVLDASRGDLIDQLANLGVKANVVLELDPAMTRLLVIRAAGRSTMVRELLRSSGVNDALVYHQRPVSGADADPVDLAMSDDASSIAGETGQ